MGIRIPPLVVVAADSAGTYTLRGLDKPSAVSPICKIHQSGNIFFAVSGIINDPITGFNVPTIVAQASRSKDAIIDRVEEAARRLRSALPKELKYLRSEDPSAYKRRFEAPKYAVAVLFFAFENKVPVLMAIVFEATSSPSGAIHIAMRRSSCPGSDCPNGVLNLYLGRHEAIDRFTADHHIRVLSPYDIVAIARSLVELEIVDASDEVQPPVDVLLVDADGPRWINKKKECPDIQSHPAH